MTNNQSFVDEIEIFCRAILIPAGAVQTSYIESQCNGDHRLQKSIEDLVRVHNSIQVNQHQSADEDSFTGHDDEEGRTETFLQQLLQPSQYTASLGCLHEYEILQVVATGGTSIVVEGLDSRLKRIVAIKVLDPALSRFRKVRERFRREAKLLATIDHPNVTKIYASGEHRHCPYLVMEFVVGQSLEDRIRQRGALGVEECLEICTEVADGIHAIHQCGLLHRDVKPANILLRSSDQRPKIADFGIARDADDHQLTHTGEVTGTPEFMSPEQARGERIDEKSDLFSFGTFIYAILTGHSPFEADTPLGAMRRVCDEDVPNLRKLDRQVPVPLANLVQHLLEKSPDRRPNSIDEVRTRLRDYVNSFRSGEFGRWEKRWKQRRLLKAMAIACCLALLIVTLTPPPPNSPFIVGLLWDNIVGAPRIRIRGLEEGSHLVLVHVPYPGAVSPPNERDVDVTGDTNLSLFPGDYLVKVMKDQKTVRTQRISLNPWNRQAFVFDENSNELYSE